MTLTRGFMWALSSMLTMGLSAPARAQGEAPVPGRRFMVDVAYDYRNFISTETLSWLGGGLGAAFGVHVADDWANSPEVQQWTATHLEGGQEYGLVWVQLPIAAGWWAIAELAGSRRDADAGRDLMRGQISAASWTYALKFAADRTRPNGDPRSFPSGHSSATFTTATVLAEHYGWKVGVPAFALAIYTGASRIVDNKHWASDVTYGAFVGLAAGRTVTLHVRGTRLALTPLPVPGGGAVQLRASR